jgi:uncharacterized caspase-like protein
VRPNFAPSYRARAALFERLDRLAQALEDLESALRIDPANAEALEGRARIRARMLQLAGGVQPQPQPRVEQARPSVAPALVAPAAPPPERRVALVIGNAGYRAVPRLENPTNDAEDIGAALRATGFTVVHVHRDVTRAQMGQALNAFADLAADADWAVVYFAGHGIELGGRNFLIPVDARLRTDRDIDDEAISLDRVLSAIEGARHLRLVILDACRDNPFLTSMRRTLAGRSMRRGLSPIEGQLPTGLVIAFAAEPGQIALDGRRNSPFAIALINRLGETGLEISQLFRNVYDDVRAATGGRQRPQTYSQLPGRPFFVRPPAVATR